LRLPTVMFKTILNGVLEQDKDNQTETAEQFKTVTDKAPTDSEVRALEFALKVCKHTKSNTIVLAKEGQLLASGVGQTSRVDALRHAIEKAHSFGFRPARALLWHRMRSSPSPTASKLRVWRVLRLLCNPAAPSAIRIRSIIAMSTVCLWLQRELGILNTNDRTRIYADFID
jgi:uncharacterized protein (DUF3084 family)